MTPGSRAGGAPYGVRLLPWCFLLFTFGVSFSIAAAHIALGIWLLVWLVCLIKKEILFQKTPIDIVILVFLIVELVAGVAGVDFWRSSWQILSLWHIVIYLLVVHSVPNRHWFLRGLAVLLVAVGLNSALGISQYFSPGFYLFQDEETIAQWTISPSRELGTYSHSMTFAGQVMLVGVFGGALFLGWLRSLKLKVLWGIPLSVILVSIPLTYLRNVWLGGMFGLALVIGFKGKKILIVFLMGIVLVFSSLAALEPGFRDRLKSLVDPEFPSNIERIGMWKVSLDMFGENPILGVGPGNYTLSSGPYRMKYKVIGKSHPHNNLLSQLTEKGMLGLGVYLWLWVVFYKETWKAWKKAQSEKIRAVLVGGMGALAAFHVGGMFEGNFGDSEVAMMMWLIVGFSLWAIQEGNSENMIQSSRGA